MDQTYSEWYFLYPLSSRQSESLYFFQSLARPILQHEKNAKARRTAYRMSHGGQLDATVPHEEQLTELLTELYNAVDDCDMVKEEFETAMEMKRSGFGLPGSGVEEDLESFEEHIRGLLSEAAEVVGKIREHSGCCWASERLSSVGAALSMCFAALENMVDRLVMDLEEQIRVAKQAEAWRPPPCWCHACNLRRAEEEKGGAESG